MSNVSIYEKNWIDLVFEDKNKVYGAYQLRQENPKTTLFAFFGGILFLFSMIGLWLLISSFGEKPTLNPIEDTTIIKISDFNYPKPDKPVVPKTNNTQPKSLAEPTNISQMVVAATPLAVDNVPTNDNLPPNSSTTTGIGTDVPTTGNESPMLTITAPAAPDGPVPAIELDRLPEYPGGIKKFCEYVGNNIEKPEFDAYSSISVIMSFVVEKDGTMSNIKVLRSSDKNLEREATRVLKALKVKWSPGYKDGEKMRTLYTLPIKVVL